MRAKIILPNFIAVLLLGLASYFYLKANLHEKARTELKQRIETMGLLFSRSEALRGFELLTDLNSQAMSGETVQAFAPVDIAPMEGETQSQLDTRVHAAWFKRCARAVEVYTELWRKKKGNRPDLILLTDRKGVTVARNITPKACPTGYNVGVGIPVVAQALKGTTTFGIWSIDDSAFSSKRKNPQSCQLVNSGLLELAAAPVWYDGEIAGTLVIGFEISNGAAKKNAKLLALDMTVLKGGSVYSSSLDTDTARKSLNQQLVHSENAKQISSAIRQGVNSAVFEIQVENRPFLALALPEVNAVKKDRIVTILMGSVDKATAGLKSLYAILVGMVLVLLVVFVAGMILTNHFLKPIMEIEEGILKVMNGEYQYRFDVKSSEVGGLSFRINQLIGTLTGEDDESENGSGEPS